MWIVFVFILKWGLIWLLNRICYSVSGWSFCGCYISCFVRWLILIIVYCLIRLDNGWICYCFIRICKWWVCWLSKSRYIWDVFFMRVCLGSITRIFSGFVCWVNSRVFDSLYYRIICLRFRLRINIFSNLGDFRFLDNFFSGFELLYIWLWGWNNMRIWTLFIIISCINSILFCELLVLFRVVCYFWCNCLIFVVIFI